MKGKDYIVIRTRICKECGMYLRPSNPRNFCDDQCEKDYFFKKNIVEKYKDESQRHYT